MSSRGYHRQNKPLKGILWIVLCCIISTYFSSAVVAQSFEFKGKRQKQTINFLKVKNLIIIPVYINEKGPYNFLLDTGVGQMIITDTAFLRTLNVKTFKRIRLQGYGIGEEIDALLTREVYARVGKATIKNIPTAIFKNDIFDLSSYLGTKIHGIIGYYFFYSFVVRINYATDKLTLYKPGSAIRKKGTAIPLKIKNGKPYLEADITLQNLKTRVNLLVDNGSSHPLMLESLKGAAFPLPAVTIPANLGVGLNGEIYGMMGRIDCIQTNAFSFEHILSGFPDFKADRLSIEGNQRNGTIGADVLNHFLVTFDYRNELLYLQKTSNYKAEFNHDMAGIEIYVRQGKTNHYFISRIEPGSPAEEAGLLKDDEILTINFRDIDSYSLNNLSEIFREKDGNAMIMEVGRRGAKVVAIFRLKKRI